MPLAQVFKTPTIRGLAAFIDGASKEVFVEILCSEKREYYPLSSAQKRLYLLYRMEPEGIHYNMPQTVPLGGDIDKERLTAVFRQLIARHESLRTSFLMKGETPVQVVHDTVPFDLTEMDAPGALAAGGNVGNDFVKPFALHEPPLFRAAVLEGAQGGGVLLMDIHHIISDGVSQEVLKKEFLRLYGGSIGTVAVAVQGLCVVADRNRFPFTANGAGGVLAGKPFRSIAGAGAARRFCPARGETV